MCKAVGLRKNEERWGLKDHHRRELLMTEQWKEHELGDNEHGLLGRENRKRRLCRSSTDFNELTLTSGPS